MFKMVVFCNSTVFVSVFITLNRGFNFFGVVPNAPTTRRITFTGISYMFFNSLFRSLYLFILSFSLSSILLSKGQTKSIILHSFLPLSIITISDLLASMTRSVVL